MEEDGTNGNEAAMHAFLILGILSDASILFLDENLVRVLVDILANNTFSELSAMCLELLYSQAEDGKLTILDIYSNSSISCSKISVIILFIFLK